MKLERLTDCNRINPISAPLEITGSGRIGGSFTALTRTVHPRVDPPRWSSTVRPAGQVADQLGFLDPCSSCRTDCLTDDILDSGGERWVAPTRGDRHGSVAAEAFGAPLP